jgi:hypothetical protein
MKKIFVIEINEKDKNSDISVVIPVTNKNLINPISEAFQAFILHCIVFHPDLAVNSTKW